MLLHLVGISLTNLVQVEEYVIRSLDDRSSPAYLAPWTLEEMKEKGERERGERERGEREGEGETEGEK